MSEREELRPRIMKIVIFQCTRIVFVYGNRTKFLLMDHPSLTKTSGYLFPSGLFFFYLSLLISGLVKVKQVLARKTSEKGLIVWGIAKRTLCKLLHTDPQVPEVSIKKEEPPMRKEVIQSFWLA